MENNIIILPEDLVDKIAAGEVVERPASVVKELVENSIDSGAKNISVEIKNGGIKFIRVTDDGLGMDEKNSELAFARHGTSKIKSVDDLYRINTLGFRGEALPSIASVSLLDMLTRTQESLSGTRIKIEGGVIKDKREAGAPIGTSIIVREIFYNIPARRKFLKSILTETRHVIDLLTRFAIVYPEISFKLTSDGREIFDFKATFSILPYPLSSPLHKMERGTGGEVQPQPQQDEPQSQQSDLRQRVADIFGKNQMERMVEIQTEIGTVTENAHKRVNISGFLGKAEIARSNRAELYLFANRRPIVSRSLYHAVQMGYGELLPKGKFPFAVVFIEIDPELVDVNVHPTKSEVRFSDEKGVHDLVYMKVKESLTSPEVIPALQTAETDKTESQAVKARLREKTETGTETVTGTEMEKERIQKSFFKEELVKHKGEAPKVEGVKEEAESKTDSSPAVGGTKKIEGDSISSVRTGVLTPQERGNLWQLADTYILSQVKGNLMVLDQHAAHERILYEEAMKNLTQKPASSQQILFPAVLELSPKEFQILETNKELIKKLGFEIKSFGGRSILVTAVPAVIKNKSGELFLKEILAELEEEEKLEKNRVKAVAKSFACHAAVKAGDKLTQEEMSTLLHQLFATEEPYSCPHGRPTVVKISIDELNKKFGRG
jgi:DNA mismatch repair protein MutL